MESSVADIAGEDCGFALENMRIVRAAVLSRLDQTAGIIARTLRLGWPVTQRQRGCVAASAATPQRFWLARPLMVVPADETHLRA
jgi:hypothetical protein